MPWVPLVSLWLWILHPPFSYSLCGLDLISEDIATVRAAYELSPVERAVMSYKGTPSSLQEDWARTIYFGNRRTFEADVALSIANLGSEFPFCMETVVLLETGQLHQDPALQPIAENFLRNAASALGRPTATTCAELADLCGLTDARLLRLTCGQTCGCTDPASSAWHLD